jgi:hypothetical protein
MEQLPNWLEDAVVAAGLTTVYNAEDWKRPEMGATAADSSGEVPPLN